ncbi:hypothetical protein ALC62_13680 [Cyphomyrmex costatus]|uniref:Uncharacterized protein n=1 Tax=Cyphomyrmex costatus TaxID=456900 RepID=A0A151I9J0_9HYME|nr:hypothetical protein ALC62_13680 [Cyphomyrmex costatus]
MEKIPTPSPPRILYPILESPPGGSASFARTVVTRVPMDTRGHDKVIEDWRIKVLVHVNHLDYEHRLGRQGWLTTITRDYRQVVLTVPDTLSTLKKPSLSIASDKKYSTSPPAPSSGSVASTTATTVHIGTSSRILTFAKVGALSLTSSTVTLTSASECKGGVSLLLSRARILSSYISCRSLSSLPKTLSTPVTGSTRKSLVSVTRESESVALARHTLVPFSAVSEILKLANDFSNLGALSLTSKIVIGSIAFSPESRSFAVTRTTDVPAGSFSRDAGKRAETAAIAGRSWFKDGCRASLVFLNLYRESGCQPTGDLAFKLAPRCSNLVEREIDSVSSCAINLDWDFNVGKQRQHTVRWRSGDAKFHPTTSHCTVQTTGREDEVRVRSPTEHEASRRDEVNVLQRCIASRTRGKGSKGSEQQAVTKDESERR